MPKFNIPVSNISTDTYNIRNKLIDAQNDLVNDISIDSKYVAQYDNSLSTTSTTYVAVEKSGKYTKPSSLNLVEGKIGGTNSHETETATVRCYALGVTLW